MSYILTKPYTDEKPSIEKTIDYNYKGTPLIIKFTEMDDDSVFHTIEPEHGYEYYMKVIFPSSDSFSMPMLRDLVLHFLEPTDYPQKDLGQIIERAIEELVVSRPEILRKKINRGYTLKEEKLIKKRMKEYSAEIQNKRNKLSNLEREFEKLIADTDVRIYTSSKGNPTYL